MKPFYHTDLMTLYCNNVLNVLPAIPDASVDAIISDPPYPMIARDYGTLTEFEWSVMMVEVCKQAQRIIKPTGSAVFILQPNSKKVFQLTQIRASAKHCVQSILAQADKIKTSVFRSYTDKTDLGCGTATYESYSSTRGLNLSRCCRLDRNSE